jgi:prepilin-type N-terminal cleavage/methylation domain-containing protein
MRRKQGFTIVELMIVIAIIAIIAAIAIPSLIQARKNGNENSAISSMRSLVTSNEQYRTRFLTYAGTLANLEATGYFFGLSPVSPKAGYLFTYTRSGIALWTCNANPVAFGQEGDRGFFADQTGVIRFADSAPASATDPPIDG